MADIRLMQGNEACARGAIAAGVRFFAGYPITPSTEIAELLAQWLPVMGGRFIQMEDEIASMGAAIGASLAGVKSMTATSGPGFSLKQENIGFAAMAEVPVVIVNVQRVGPSTGGPTAPAQGDVMQARWGTHGDHPVVALTPWSVAETYDVAIEAVDISERLRIPVIVLMDEVIGHMRERFEMPDTAVAAGERRGPTAAPGDFVPYRPPAGTDVPEMAAFGTGYRVHVTGLCHDERGLPTNDPAEVQRLITRCCDKVEQRRSDLARYEISGDDDPETVVVAYGCTARAAARALKMAAQAGQRVRMFRPVTLWPFPGEQFQTALGDARSVLVAEMNLGQLALEVDRWAGGRPVRRLGQVTGELIRPERILAALGGED